MIAEDPIPVATVRSAEPALRRRMQHEGTRVDDDRDDQPFMSIYEAHYQTILNYTYRRTLSVDVAEDLTSSTFLKALGAYRRCRKSTSVKAWLYAIATNEVNMYWRGLQRRRRHEIPSAEELARVRFRQLGPEPLDEREEKCRQYQELHRHLARLPERYQTVLMLRFFEELSYEEVAAASGKRVGTVKSLIHRGLKRLQAQMTNATR